MNTTTEALTQDLLTVDAEIGIKEREIVELETQIVEWETQLEREVQGMTVEEALQLYHDPEQLRNSMIALIYTHFPADTAEFDKLLALKIGEELVLGSGVKVAICDAHNRDNETPEHHAKMPPECFGVMGDLHVESDVLEEAMFLCDLNGGYQVQEAGAA